MVECEVDVSEAVVRRLGGRRTVDDVAARAASACQEALAAEGAAEWELALSLVSSQRVRALNRRWRGIDRATDVLSFSQREGESAPDGVGPPVLGDVVVSLEVAQRQARAFGHGLAREVAFLAVHGTLHLLGYDHQTPPEEAAMMAKAESVLCGRGLTRDA